MYDLGSHLNQKVISQDSQWYISWSYSTLFWGYWKIYHCVCLHVAFEISWIKCGSAVSDIGGSSRGLLSIRESKSWTNQTSLFSRAKKNPMVGSKDMIDDHGSRKMIDGYGSRKMFRYAENIDLYITACVKILMATTRLASLYCKFYALMISKHKSSKKFSEHDLSGRLPGGDEIFFSGLLSLIENQTKEY